MPAIEKEIMYQEIEREFDNNPYVVFSNFDGVSVADLSDARAKMNVSANRSMLVKHAMARKILQSRGVENVEDLLTGSVLLTFGDKEPQEVCKGVVEAGKVSKNINCTGVLFEGKLETADFVKKLSLVPSRQELLTQLVVRLNSPVAGFVCVLANTMRGLATVLDQVRKQKEEAAPAS